MTKPLSVHPVLDACQAKICLLDEDGVILHINALASKLFTELLSPEGDKLALRPISDFAGNPLDRCLPLTEPIQPSLRHKQPWRLSLPVREGLLEAMARPAAGERIWVLTWRVQKPAEGGEQIQALEKAIDGMAACDLRPPPREVQERLSARFRQRVLAGLANLAEAMRQNREVAGMISATTAKIAAHNHALEERTREQAKAIEVTSVNMEELSGTVRNTAQNASDAAKSAQSANRLAESGRDEVLKVVESMAAIDQGSLEIKGIIDVINQIAFQTNILALNAAVEAARANEHGRGFAVVAGEVRALAHRSADAAGKIRTLIESSMQTNANGREQAEQARARIIEVVEGVRLANERIDAISKATGEQSQGIQHANEALSRIDSITQRNQELVAELAEQIGSLETQEASLKSATEVFQLPESRFTHPQHEKVSGIAAAAASAIGKLLEAGVRKGKTTPTALFEIDYQPIKNTDPKKYHTGFDAYADEVFPTVQEAILEDHPELIYAITADQKGYVPTHNRRFSQPLTGNREKDMAGNRGKRIFDDPVGGLVGRHEEPFKLQTYRRDTGELMFDLSVPIYVDGRHWGGFRIGYRID